MIEIVMAYCDGITAAAAELLGDQAAAVTKVWKANTQGDLVQQWLYNDWEPRYKDQERISDCKNY